jgi:hypothetical protein
MNYAVFQFVGVMKRMLWLIKLINHEIIYNLVIVDDV